MNNICFKSLIIFISSIMVFSIFAEDETNEELLLKFENNCVHDREIDQSQCEELMDQMQSVLTENNYEEASTVSPTCDGVLSEESSVEEAEDLSDEVAAAASKMQCTMDDVAEVAKVCHIDIMCNLSRSVATAVDKVAPDFISKRIRGGIEAAMEDMPSSNKCMDSEESDCLTEVVTSFVANIVGTFNTLKDVAKAAVNTIWGIKDYLFKKSDDLHTAANSTTSELSKFIESPWGYIKEKFFAMKSAVDTWVKKEVFCQKWEGTPHSSECIEPLNEYDCLNCNDGMNAFCAGAGVFASEAVIAIGTAGTLTAANIAMKAGLKLGVSASAKAAARISAKVPSLGKAPTSRVSIAVSTTAKVSMATLKKMSDAISRYKTIIGEAALTRHLISLEKSVESAISTATKPLSFFDDMAEAAMKGVVAKGVAKKGSDRLSHFVRAASRYERVKIADILRRGERLTNNSRKLTVARSTRRIWGKRDSGDHLSRTTSHTSDSLSSSNRPIGRDDRRAQLEASRNRSNERNRELELERQRQTDRQREIEKQRELEKQREQAKAHEQTKESEETSGATGVTPSMIPKATRYAVAADLSAKAYRSIREESMDAASFMTDEAAQKIIDQHSALGFKPTQDTPLDQRGIEERSGQSFSNEVEAKQFAHQMRRKYGNPQNRDEIVNSFKSRGFSQNEANSLYESEKKFYEQGFLDRDKGDLTRAFGGISKSASATRTIEEGDKANQLVDDIRSQIAAIQSDIAKERNEVNDEDDEIPRERVLPRATPYSTPTPTGGYRGSSFSNGSPIGPSQGEVSEVINSESIDQGSVPASEEALIAVDNTETVEESDEEGEKGESEDLAISQSQEGVSKVEYLDLYFKLMEEVDNLKFSAASIQDQRLTRGVIDIIDYEVLSISVKNKQYKIFRHKESKESVAFLVDGEELEQLKDFPKDLI